MKRPVTPAGRPGLLLMTDSLQTGGTERQFMIMVHALSAGSFDVHAACLARTGGFLSSVPGVEEFSPGPNLFGIRSQRARFALARRMRELGIVVAHAFDFYANLVLIPAARMARVPVVIGSHRQLGDLMTAAKFALQKQIFRLCDAVVCNSQAAADRLSGLPERKMKIIPNALPDSAFEKVLPLLPRENGLLRVGMVARMNDAAKNHRKFLLAASEIARQMPNVEFVFAGDGPLRQEVEGFAGELGLSTRCRFLGNRSDVPAVLASLDVLVQPSSSESLSNVILEAMAGGIPVVATNVGGNPELISDGATGILATLDEHDLACAALKLLQDPDLRNRIGRAAQHDAGCKYRLNSIRQQYEDLYRSLLPSPNAATQTRNLTNLA